MPVEPEPLTVLRRLEAEQPNGGAHALLSNDTYLARTPEGACVHHRSGASLGCRLETEVGVAALPHTCRQFPRILLADERGWHQSLSAWCVTAANLIVDGGRNFLSFDHILWDERVHLDALDARHTWPPELRPGVLMGHVEYAKFEDVVLNDCLATAIDNGQTCADGLQQALAWSDCLRRWRAAGPPLLELLTGSPPGALAARSLSPLGVIAKDLTQRIPPQWRPIDWPQGLTDARLDGRHLSRVQAEAALARYVATRLVGTWLAYQGKGVMSVAASLVSSYGLAALALSRFGEGPVTLGRMASAIRAADWLQLHLLDREEWAGWCTQWEEAEATQLSGWLTAGSELLDRLTWRPS